MSDLLWTPSSTILFIGLGGMEKEIICTQGPMPSTTEDFWRMVWQEKCVAIIMLCRVIENGKKKCEQYWPLEADEWVIKVLMHWI